MKRSVKARAVAMGAMVLLQAMMSRQTVRADLVDEGGGNYRFNTSAPNPFPFATTLTAHAIVFDAGSGVSVAGGGYALQVTTTGSNPYIIMNNGSSITLDSNVGAALVWELGGELNQSGTISATNTTGMSLNSNRQYLINNSGSINGSVGMVQDSAAFLVLDNHVSGQITGTQAGLVGYTGTMQIGNAGSIRGTGGGAIGVYAEQATLQLTNTGVVRGHSMGVYVVHEDNAEIYNYGSIIGDNSPAIRLGAPGTISNQTNGEITSYGGEAIFLDNGGTVNNQQNASIVGITTGVRGYQMPTTVTNHGTIIGHNNAGALLEEGGYVINEATGVIQGSNIGVQINTYNYHGELRNRGQIIGDNGPGDGYGVYVSGGGEITNEITGSITGNDTGVQISGGFGWVDNRGQITGINGYGVRTTQSSTLFNRTGATITGRRGVRLGDNSVLSNEENALIQTPETNGLAVEMGANSDLTNAGQILAESDHATGIRHMGGSAHNQIFNTETGLIRAHGTALELAGDIPTIWNSGLIQSTHGAGIVAYGVGNLANDSYGEIESYLQGIVILDGGGVANLQNAGSIISSFDNGVEIHREGGLFYNLDHGLISGTLNNTDKAGVRTTTQVTVQNYGTIYGGSGIYGTHDRLTVYNQGLIQGQNYHGIWSEAGLQLTNAVGAEVRSFVAYVAIANVGGTLNIDNAGLIQGIDYGIYHGGPGVGEITNQTTGIIRGGTNAITAFAPMTIQQHGRIEGDIVTSHETGDNVNLYTGSVTVGHITDAGGADPINLRGAGEGDYTGIISGFNRLNKYDNGTWTLYGTVNDLSGGLRVHAGTLVVNGTIRIIDGDVYSGATLKGNGVIDGISNGSLFIRDGATLAPGNSIGGLTITEHSLYLNAGSILEIEVNVDESDWLDVEGEVHLAGTLSVKDVSGGTIANGTQYNFLSAGGGFFGTFSDIIDDSALLNFTVSPNGQFLMLTAVQEMTFSDLARTPNEQALAAVLDAAMNDGELDDLIDEMIGMSQQQIERAFERLSARSSGAVSQAAAMVIQRIGQDTTQVARNLRMGLGASASNSRGSWSLPGGSLLASARNDPQVLGAAMAAAESGSNTQPVSDDKRWNLYVSPFGQFGSMEPGTNRSGYDFAAGGVFGGIDYQLDDNHVVGWSVAYAHTSVDLDGGAGDGKINSLRFGPYLNYTRDAWTFDAALTGGVHWFDQSRNVIVGGFNQTAVNDHMGYDLSVHGTLGYEIDMDPWKLTPSFTLQYVHMMEDGYSETGGGAANLTVNDTTYNSLRSILGVRLGRTFDWMNIKVTPEVWAGWAFELLNEQHDIVSGFSGGSGPGFNTRIDGGDRHSAIIGAGAAALLRDDLSVHLRYEADVASSNQTHTFWAGFEWRF